MHRVTSKVIHSGGFELQDRAEILKVEDRVILAVADGAGGMAGGAMAADSFINAVRESAESATTPARCCAILTEIDRKLRADPAGGETTGIIVVVDTTTIFGASVGDSMAWLFSSGERLELTSGQPRRPFLGGGCATPHSFSFSRRDGVLVVATDGLWKYTSLNAIEQTVRKAGPAELAQELSGLVRLRSGTFPDDVAILTST